MTTPKHLRPFARPRLRFNLKHLFGATLMLAIAFAVIRTVTGPRPSRAQALLASVLQTGQVQEYAKVRALESLLPDVLVKGTTTEQQVVRMLGHADKTEHRSNGTVTAWYYMGDAFLVVHFDAKTMVVSHWSIGWFAE